jgi:hypothetical protein
MTLDDLKQTVVSAPWFARLGEFAGGPNCIAIRNIKTAGYLELIVELEAPHERLAWEWLPTEIAATDPVYGNELRELSRQLGKEEELRDVTLDIYKMALHALRPLDNNQRLIIGPHDLTGAAKSSALYSIRKAATEIVVGKPRFWCSLVPIFAGGNWPSGLSVNGDVIVF